MTEGTSDHGVISGDQILDLMLAFSRTAIVKAALELRLMDGVAAGRTTARAVAEAQGTDLRATAVVLDALCALGLMDKVDGEYRLVSLVEYALPYMHSMTPFTLDPDAFLTWNRLPEAVRQGRPVGARTDYWENFARGTRHGAKSQGMMLARRLGLPNGVRTRILDLGCGSGGVGYGLAETDPGATVTGLDTESVLEIAAEYAAELGLADRVTLQAGDILGTAGYGVGDYDVVVLANILHLFDPPTDRALLAKARDALAPGGRVAILEIVPDNDRRRAVFPLVFAVELLMRTPNGAAYTVPEISAWVSEAGFRDINCETEGYNTTIIATKR